MATIKKYNNSTWENTTARKYETKSEIITPPTTIYADGTAITSYTIKGNTVQNGTPTPSNPVDVVGVGELETSGEHSEEYKIPISSGGVTTNIYLGSTQTTRQIRKLVLTGDESWTKSSTYQGSFFSFIVIYSLSENYTAYCSHLTFTTLSQYEKGKFCFNGSGSTRNCNVWFNQFDNNTTVEELKAYLAQQYANGTPVTVWYVLATATTGTVNEPLQKIGTYADGISGASIPTTDGANTISVDTTVQPSEFTATWTGWHDASVKEWDGSQWNE